MDYGQIHKICTHSRSIKQFSSISFNKFVDPCYVAFSPNFGQPVLGELFMLNSPSLKCLCHLITSLLEIVAKPRSINFRVALV